MFFLPMLARFLARRWKPATGNVLAFTTRLVHLAIRATQRSEDPDPTA